MIDEHGNRNGLPQIPGDAPAFPVSVPGAGDNGWHGLSLRDWFAGQAISGLVLEHSKLGQNFYDDSKLASDAYQIADAMIKERGGRPMPSPQGTADGTL